MQIKDELTDILKRLEAKIESETESQAIVVQETDKNLPVPIPPISKNRNQWNLCAYPVDLCRVSPFFPLNRKFTGKRKYVSDIFLVKTAWGAISYTGLTLSTYEEDVLVALIIVMESKKEETEYEGRKTYRYQGHLLPILKALGYKSFSKEAYKHVFNSLKILSTATMQLTVKKSFLVSPLIFGLKWDEETKEISVALNPYFYEVFHLKSYALIEIDKRMRISSPIGKALYRFVASQRDGWKGHFLVLAKTLNLDLQRPTFKIREDIRNAIKLLIKEKILNKKSRLENEIVLLIVCDAKKVGESTTPQLKTS